jgi:hypothetical protein
MPKSKTAKGAFQVLQIVALIATIISAIIGIYSAISPDSISSLTKQSIGFNDKFKTDDGDIRQTVVPAQTTVFFISAVVFILVLGGAMAIFYYGGTDREARSAAVGGKKNRIYYALLPIPFIIIFLLLGNALPRGIFNPTHERILNLYFPLGAWAKKSIFGGCVLGLIGAAISGLGGILITKYSLKFRQSSKEKRMREKLRSS